MPSLDLSFLFKQAWKASVASDARRAFLIGLGNPWKENSPGSERHLLNDGYVLAHLATNRPNRALAEPPTLPLCYRFVREVHP